MIGSLAADLADMHKKADQAREAGETAMALDLYNRLVIGYQKNGDYEGIFNALTGRLISWQHLYNLDQDRVYAIFAQKEAEAMALIAKDRKICGRDHLIHFLQGKTFTLLKDYAAAENAFRMALETYPKEDAERGDWLAHWGEALHKIGLKEAGINTILQGVQAIQAHEIDPFRKSVWISGAYLRLAKLFFEDDDMNQAKHYFQKADEIISAMDQLVIRKRQLEQFRVKLFPCMPSAT